MRIVAIGDGGSGAIWFLGAFGLLAGLGLLLIVARVLVPAMSASGPSADEQRAFALKFTAGWALASLPFALGFALVWMELDHVAIDKGGAWSLQNAVDFELGRLGGGVERTATFTWLTPDEVDHEEELSPHMPGELTVVTTDGAEFKLYFDGGAEEVLARLGYSKGGPCADKKSPFLFPSHTYTHRGPWCPDPERHKPAAAAGEPVFSLWSEDGWWYPARAIRSEQARAEVQYSDGSKEWRKKRAEFGPRTLPSVVHLQGDWQGKGKYFPCVVINDLEGGRYDVEYADGSREAVSDERLRFQLPRPDDLIFAEGVNDRWWYSATVVGATLNGVLVRPAGHPADESRTWAQVMHLQLPKGATVEVDGKQAVVLAHAGLQAKVRFVADKSEATVAIGDLRFRPSKSRHDAEAQQRSAGGLN